MSAMFELSTGGIGVMADPDDNPDGHDVPHHDAGVRISIEVTNVGDEPGIATVGVEVDDVFVGEWVSDELQPGETEAGYFNLGRLAEGEHVILVYVNPGSGQNDNQTNTIQLP